MIQNLRGFSAESAINWVQRFTPFVVEEKFDK